MCPLAVAADHTHPSKGFFAASQRLSSSDRTRGLKGSIRRAAAVLPCVTHGPARPLSRHHRRRGRDGIERNSRIYLVMGRW